jgi:hypothetical protein
MQGKGSRGVDSPKNLSDKEEIYCEEESPI